jgi:hypothetical protein
MQTFGRSTVEAQRRVPTRLCIVEVVFHTRGLMGEVVEDDLGNDATHLRRLAASGGRGKAC